MSTVTSTLPTPATRMPAAERRELILASATEVFGEHGYAGTTTDQVAQAAGISQPYVVRMFGTKENLFLEVMGRALGKLKVAFREVIAESASPDETAHRLGAAYADLITDRGILLALMQSFVQGGDRVVGEAARCGFLEIYALLRDEAQLTPEQVRDFLAHGMLFNTLIAIQLPLAYDTNADARELMDVAFGAKLQKVLGAAGSKK